METALRKIAERIAAAETRRRQTAEYLRNELPDFIFPVTEQIPATLSVVGVDGGLVKKSFHGFDLVVVRAAAVCFTYRDGRVNGVAYYPSRFPVPQLDISEEANEMDWITISVLLRVKAEVSAALKGLEFRPDVLLLHGPVVPHYADKPPKTSPAYPLYVEVRDLYHQLYEQAKGTLLAGVVEDTRGTVACDHMRSLLSRAPEAILNSLVRDRDSTLLTHILHPGERTGLIPYTAAPDVHPVLKDFPGVDVRCFFLKIAAQDRPVRVDTPNRQESRLAEIILSISGKHPGYGMPAPLIEADNVVKLPEQELETLSTRIFNLAGTLPGALSLKREQRPF